MSLVRRLKDISLSEDSGQKQCDLNPPHGGELVDLIATPTRIVELRTESCRWPSWELTPRQICDLELLLNGGFSPLRGFMSRGDYESTCGRMRLADGKIWPIPVVLDVTVDFARSIGSGSSIALRDAEGVMLAAMHVDEVWQPDPQAEAEAVCGTTSTDEPGMVKYLLECRHPWYVGGRLEGIQLPLHYDFRELRLMPSELRSEFVRLGWRRIVAFQTRRLMHRAHKELTLRAAQTAAANILIHPSLGMTRIGDADHYSRVRCYRALLSRYPQNTAKLALLPMAMRSCGPRQAVWQAVVSKNYGCSHIIVGQDLSEDDEVTASNHPYTNRELLLAHEKEIGIKMISSRTMVYLEDKNVYVPEDELPNGVRPLRTSESELRDCLKKGSHIPSWVTFPEVLRELRRHNRPRHRQGLTVFFTGLSGSGKSTISNVLLAKLLEKGGRPVTLLDGDIVRKHLSSELGYSRAHRDINIRRIGFVASEITKNGGIAICAPIAPYDEVRKQVRAMIEPYGGFILVHLATSLEVCERRDRKGMYAKARAGLVQHFTGISDPYEVPQDADVVADTNDLTPEEVAREIFTYMKRQGYFRANGQDPRQASSSVKHESEFAHSA